MAAEWEHARSLTTYSEQLPANLLSEPVQAMIPTRLSAVGQKQRELQQHMVKIVASRSLVSAEGQHAAIASAGLPRMATAQNHKLGSMLGNLFLLAAATSSTSNGAKRAPGKSVFDHLKKQWAAAASQVRLGVEQAAPLHYQFHYQCATALLMGHCAHRVKPLRYSTIQLME